MVVIPAGVRHQPDDSRDFIERDAMGEAAVNHQRELMKFFLKRQYKFVGDQRTRAQSNSANKKTRLPFTATAFRL
jgi:hypothetical protein